MDFEPHNFPALVASVIRSDPTLAEPLKDIFAAYGRNEDLDERWARIDSKFHQSLRLILEDLNEIDDPVSLDQEIQVLLQAIDQAQTQIEEDDSAPEPKRTKKAGKPAKKKAAKGKAAAKDTKPAKKAKPAAKKTKTAAKKAKKPSAKKKAAKKTKARAPAKKKAGKVVKKSPAKTKSKAKAKPKPKAAKAKAKAKPKKKASKKKKK